MIPVSDYGEDRLVAELLAQLPLTTGYKRLRPILGAGDDCAVVRRPAKGRWQVLKTDCLIEGVHFASATPPEQVGWKALCRPLSDLAAAGARPAHALVTLALPGNATVDYARGIYAGIGRAAAEFAVDVVGGETARSPGGCFLSIALTGTVPRGRAPGRRGGKVGDRLYVTGRLGGSFASGRHLNFRPRVAEGRWLMSHFGIHAMMDLSDGLATDLPRLAAASGIGFRVVVEQVPRAADCSLEQALGDGEDYELLFAVDADEAARLETTWRARWPQLELSAIGELTQPGIAVGLFPARGYDHFAPNAAD